MVAVAVAVTSRPSGIIWSNSDGDSNIYTDCDIGISIDNDSDPDNESHIYIDSDTDGNSESERNSEGTSDKTSNSGSDSGSDNERVTSSDYKLLSSQCRFSQPHTPKTVTFIWYWYCDKFTL